MAFKNDIRRKEYQHVWYMKNKERILKMRKEYRITNLDTIKKYDRGRSQRKVSKEWKREWNQKNRGYMRKWYRQHHKEQSIKRKTRWNSDLQYKLSFILRSRLHKAIKRGQKKGSAVRDLGCTIAELKFYLEGQFKDGMTWANWSATGWHIDHKIPLAFFDLSKREQILQAVHYTNLQPMWAKENLVKGGKYIVPSSPVLPHSIPLLVLRDKHVSQS